MANKKKEVDTISKTTHGDCCQSGCDDCPYDYSSKVDPNIPAELQNPWSKEDQDQNE